MQVQIHNPKESRMTSLKRSFGLALMVGLAASLIPAKVSPTGGIEAQDLCASSACRVKPGGFCYDQGEIFDDYRNVMG